VAGAEEPDGAWSDYAIELGVLIHRTRIAKALSQERVAYESGLSRYTYQKLERGHSTPGRPANPTIKTLIAVSQALGVDISDILPNRPPDLRAR